MTTDLVFTKGKVCLTKAESLGSSTTECSQLEDIAEDPMEDPIVKMEDEEDEIRIRVKLEFDNRIQLNNKKTVSKMDLARRRSVTSEKGVRLSDIMSGESMDDPTIGPTEIVEQSRPVKSYSTQVSLTSFFDPWILPCQILDLERREIEAAPTLGCSQQLH